MTMLAPIDKIRRGGNDILQIVVTTSCNLFSCSNCTQLLPFRKDYLHMSVACFEEAVRSVEDWPGVVALFGGNPCSHPQFERLCDILEDVIPDQERRGLWSNALLGKGEIAQRVFWPRGRFNLNAHGDTKAALEIQYWLPGKLIPQSDHRPSWHAAILADYRDFGIPEAEWIRKRETCDINRKWSGAIVERAGKPYGYFCEVAAALDGVRGENHGMPAVSGWWQSAMAAFDDQVRQCCDRGCGVPLRGKGHLDAAATYDVSLSWELATRDFRGRIARQLHEHHPEPTEEATDYMALRSVK